MEILAMFCSFPNLSTEYRRLRQKQKKGFRLAIGLHHLAEARQSDP